MSLKTFAAKMEVSVAGFWHDDFVPWFKTLLINVAHAEVAMLLPLANSAAGALATELVNNKDNLGAFAETAKKILRNTAAAAETAGIQAAGGALMTAVTTAIVAQQAALPLGGEAPPPLPPIEPTLTDEEIAALKTEGKNPDGSEMTDEQKADAEKAKHVDALGFHQDGTPWTDDEWAIASENISAADLTAAGRNLDGSPMNARERKKAGLPPVES